ncbi:glucosaminidase domain-containing protein [Neptunitalea lumnitzerae]|uniref:Peptidoglycan hydrolase n=1 Tax=Neptunitalea lumnitzerae TaxID=2965509 RepID=A0ABQ5ME87_9FLAO|nr:glucosaminidase domain-containing protein [Neptunitalea sp. Y10]GLB47662.1 hemagglutinin [Neptunitalea sp. Y10]
MTFKKILFYTFLVVALAACGGKKKASAKKKKYYHKPTKTTEQVVTAPEVKEQEEILTATSTVVVKTNTVEEYINVYKDIAMVEMQRYKIPASITLAQAILESGSGKGELTLKANNHFGIKCHTGWTGPSVTHDDDEKGECFRKYKYPSESFEDHSKFLTSRGRYGFLFDLKPSDYKGWARGLKKAGYATDPKYPNKLISIIERYELYEYDKLVLKDTYELVVETVVADAGETIHVVEKGDTLYSISRKYGVSVESIQKANNMRGTNINIGQKLKIDK